MYILYVLRYTFYMKTHKKLTLEQLKARHWNMTNEVAAAAQWGSMKQYEKINQERHKIGKLIELRKREQR